MFCLKFNKYYIAIYFTKDKLCHILIKDYRKNPGQISASKLSIQDKDKVTRDDHQENNPDDLTLLRTGR
jgi:hypothetical protein